MQGGRQRCHQDNPSCSFAHQKASIPPFSYSFFMFTLVFEMHGFWYKTILFPGFSDILATSWGSYTWQGTFTLNISANFYFLRISGRTHINIAPGIIKRAQISLSVASSKDSSLLLDANIRQGPTFYNRLHAKSSFKLESAPEKWTHYGINCDELVIVSIKSTRMLCNFKCGLFFVPNSILIQKTAGFLLNLLTRSARQCSTTEKNLTNLKRRDTSTL